MEICQLVANNLQEVTCKIDHDLSYGIAGLSGSGKSTFCSAVADESMKRVVTLLPKSEYRFLFSDKLKSNFSAQDISNMPLVFYLGKSGFGSNPRSTVGTHTGVFKEIRNCFAEKFDKTSDFFSFNTSIMWCPKCKGRGSSAGKECSDCQGTRYTKEIMDYKIEAAKRRLSIPQVNGMSVIEIMDHAAILNISASKLQLLQNMVELDIGYLSLDRIMSTLSGGETVRVLLAEFMTECKHSLVIIDEVSIGLDHNTLVNVIERVSKLGESNQIWLIDHSDVVLKATKGKLFFGPGSGKNGGRIVDESPRPEPIYCDINTKEIKDYYVFHDLAKRNINIASLSIPKNRIITITGESGCGKSTLVKDCIVPAITKNYKKIMCDIIGQDRNQSITSKSTIATFLDIKKRLDKYGNNLLASDLCDIADVVKKDKYIYPKISMLLELGLGYLSFDRKVQSLSTGEFQCLHLVSNLTSNWDDEMILIFDEPSKGLSQNILNLLMKVLRKIVEDEKKTILIIEHNNYIIQCSDYIMDFGKRKSENVTKLDIISNETWAKNFAENKLDYEGTLCSSISTKIKGIEKIGEDIENQYAYYENIFKGGLLKKFSQTAQWIYGDYETNQIFPVITMDLEKNIYSKNTFLFEIAGIINALIRISKTGETEKFDFFSKDNLCECCKGTGKKETIDFDQVIKDENKGLWDGLLQDDVMLALKKYNYSKIKFLFKEVKKAAKADLSKPYAQMNEFEKNVFLYGYWKESFYDAEKKTQRKWQGIIHLIVKYMRSSKSSYKDIINNSKESITCPMCKGSVLGHDEKLSIEDKDIRDIITETITENRTLLEKIPQMKEVISICGEDVVLNQDVAELPHKIQVKLKMLDMKYASLYRYMVVLKNVAPFRKDISSYLDDIARENKILELDYHGIDLTKEELLEKYFSKGKIKASSFVYELFGYKKINTEINKIRKQYPCEYCQGRKVLREESIFDGVDVTEFPCLSCRQTGLSKKGLKEKVMGMDTEAWLNGSLNLLDGRIPDSLENISITAKISELNKKQIVDLANYIGE